MELQYDKTKDSKKENQGRWNFVTSVKKEKRLIFESIPPQAMDVIYPKFCNSRQSNIPWVCFISEAKKGTETGMKNYASLAQFAERGYIIVILHNDSLLQDMKSLNQRLLIVTELLKEKKYSCDIERMALWMEQMPFEVPKNIQWKAFVAYQENQDNEKVSVLLNKTGENSNDILCLSGGDGLWTERIFDLVEDYIVSHFE